MGSEDMVYTVAVEVKFIEDIENLTSRLTENGVTALFDEGFNDNFST